MEFEPYCWKFGEFRIFKNDQGKMHVCLPRAGKSPKMLGFSHGEFNWVDYTFSHTGVHYFSTLEEVREALEQLL